jgi:hypothetical protein
MGLYYLKLNSAAIRSVIKVSAILFTLLIIADTLFIEGLHKLQSLVIVCGSATIIALAGAYFWQLYNSGSNERISRDPWFWFSCAFIVYFGASVPYLGMFNYLWSNYQDFFAIYYFYIYISFTILLHTLIIIGFLCRASYQKSS